MKKIITLSFFVAYILMGCSFEESWDSGSAGTGGSTARFTVVDNHLYTVDNSRLHTFNITDSKNIDYKGHQWIGYGIETIFPLNNTLFMGARNGMYIYNLKNPDNPEQESYINHFLSNDPVVVNGDYAYVTLQSWNRNRLQIYDVKNLKNPILLKEYEMKEPKGLSVDNDLLFICDNFLKVYKIDDGNKIELLHTFNIQANDVIAKDGHLFVIANDGLYQYSYDGEEMEELSKVPLNYSSSDNN